MKVFIEITIIIFILINKNATYSQVSINNNDSLPHSSAMLEISSVDRGLLIPRMTETQRTSITNAATGLMVFQTNNVKGFYYWNGNAWLHLTEGIMNLTTNYLPKWDGAKLINSAINDLNGNIGIGTMIPTNALEVNGEIYSTDTIKTSKRFKDKTGFIMPVGTILAYGGENIPEGWLICDGGSVSRTQYADLFDAIGIAWGSGDGATTFHLPDLRGIFARGLDGNAGNDPDKTSRTASNMGGNTGNSVGSLQDDELESHRHTIPYYLYDASQFASVSANRPLVSNTGVRHEIQSGKYTGYFGGLETRPKNVYVNYIIKY